MTLVMYTHLHSFKFSLFLLLNWPLRREHREYFIIILQNCDYWKCLKIVFILCYILSFIYEYIKDNSMNKKRFVVPTHPGIRWFVITFQIDCCTTRRHAKKELAQENTLSTKKAFKESNKKKTFFFLDRFLGRFLGRERVFLSKFFFSWTLSLFSWWVRIFLFSYFSCFLL